MDEKNNLTSKEDKPKKVKPFYKKWWFVVGVILLVFFLFIKITQNTGGDNWSEIELAKHIPELKKGKLDIGSNLSNYLSAYIKNVSKSDYQDYKNECIKFGYTVESDSNGNNYEAYNGDGYKLSLRYYSDKISIILEAPEEMKELEWPTMGVATRIPKPKSSMGKVVDDSSNAYHVYVNNMTTYDFDNYVKECKEKGFVVDYVKNDTSYEAKNSSGYRLNVSYTGNNIVSILIQTPEKKEEPKKDEPKQNESKENDSSSSNNKIRPDFKKAMDSYEKLMDEYISFMKKYQKDPSNTSLLKDYSEYLKKYTDAVEDFEKWNSKDLNKEELSYYLDVQNRVNQKLLSIS